MKEKTVLVSDSAERFIWLDGVINPAVARRFKKLLAGLNNYHKESDFAKDRRIARRLIKRTKS